MTLIEGKISTAQERLCMIGISSFPPPDKVAKIGENRYIKTAKIPPSNTINLRNSLIRVKLYSALSIVLYLATCLATATGIPAVEMSKNQA